MKKLPIGIQTFENLIREGYCYVDKTPFIDRLASSGKYYFLSRPRRFGKSLFLSTIKAAYQGKRELFEGLHLYDHWNWETINPVVHISFGSGVMRTLSDVQVRFEAILQNHEREYGVTLQQEDLRERFTELIAALEEKTGHRVVVLIDEYDKPILDNIEKQDLAVTLREELKNYYSVIKDADPHVEFVLITGVSKFSKVSLFSGLNNLEDITINATYSSICGYTQNELGTIFHDYIQDVDIDQVQNWYNGYNWLGEKVYNPFDILLYLKNKKFSNYWFETGTPAFLIKLMEQGKYHIPDIESFQAGEEIVGSFDIEDITLETLLFQTGYLTLTGCEQIGSFTQYGLGYPNLEVKSSLCNAFLTRLSQDRLAKTRNQSALLHALMAHDPDRPKASFQAFFAFIPHDWYRKNQIAGYEGYYASIVYCYFASTGLDVRPETPTNKGQIDLVLHFQDRVYVIEFKVVEQAGTGKALQQIRDKGYAEQFAGRETYLIGIEFSSEERNIVGFKWERAE